MVLDCEFRKKCGIHKSGLIFGENTVMKNLLWFLCLPLLMFSAGCKKCYNCTNKCTLCKKTGEPSQNICADQYTFGLDYSAAIEGYRANGFSCNTGPSTNTDKICSGPLFVEPLRLAKEEQGYNCTAD